MQMIATTSYKTAGTAQPSQRGSEPAHNTPDAGSLRMMCPQPNMVRSLPRTTPSTR
jgi:hypothetical protein